MFPPVPVSHHFFPGRDKGSVVKQGDGTRWLVFVREIFSWKMHSVRWDVAASTSSCCFFGGAGFFLLGKVSFSQSDRFQVLRFSWTCIFLEWNWLFIPVCLGRGICLCLLLIDYSDNGTGNLSPCPFRKNSFINRSKPRDFLKKFAGELQKMMRVRRKISEKGSFTRNPN